MNRLITFTWQNILRNKLLSLGAISVVMLVSFFLLLLDGIGFLIQKSSEGAQKNIDYTVFLSRSVNVEDTSVQELVAELRAMSVSVKQISKQQAIKEAEKSFTSDLTNFAKTRDILPASLVFTNIQGTTPEKIYKVISQEKYKTIIQGADDRTFLKEQTNRLTQFSGIEQSVTIIFITLYILFTLVAVLILFNTIQLLIHNRSEEIEIMELVGAEKNFIRFPFFAESLFLSGMGVMLGIFLFSFLLWQMSLLFSTQAVMPSTLLFGSIFATLKEFFIMQWWFELLKLLLIFMGGSFLSTRYAVKNYLPNL